MSITFTQMDYQLTLGYLANNYTKEFTLLELAGSVVIQVPKVRAICDSLLSSGFVTKNIVFGNVLDVDARSETMYRITPAGTNHFNNMINLNVTIDNSHIEIEQGNKRRYLIMAAAVIIIIAIILSIVLPFI
ncbi:MAG: hypothetical protein ACTSSH_08725 [Candidatus Heimdallarchaeota archaeon]